MGAIRGCGVYIAIIAVLLQLAAQSTTSGTTISATDLCSQPTATIITQADADYLSQCPSIQDSVLISANLPTNLSFAMTSSNIPGNFTIHNARNLRNLYTTGLQSIDGTLAFQDAYGAINFNFNFIGLHNITSLIVSNCDSLVPGLEPNVNVQNITIANSSDLELPLMNPNINSFTKTGPGETGLENMDHISTIKNNLLADCGIQSDDGNNPISFQNLTVVTNISVSGCLGAFFPALIEAESLRINNSSSSIMSLPELKWILGKTYNETTFKLTNNTFMQGIYVPVLGSVRGDVVIANNAVLDTLSFPNLAMVEGNMLLSGGFDRVSFNPDLTITGNLIINTTAPFGYACDNLNASMFKTIYQKFICQDLEYFDNTGLNMPNATLPIAYSFHPQSTTAFVLEIVFPVVAFIAILISFVVWKNCPGCCCCIPCFARRRRKSDIGPTLPELGRGAHHEKTELPATTKPTELAATNWGPVPDSYELFVDDVEADIAKRKSDVEYGKLSAPFESIAGEGDSLIEGEEGAGAEPSSGILDAKRSSERAVERKPIPKHDGVASQRER